MLRDRPDRLNDAANGFTDVPEDKPQGIRKIAARLKYPGGKSKERVGTGSHSRREFSDESDDFRLVGIDPLHYSIEAGDDLVAEVLPSGAVENIEQRELQCLGRVLDTFNDPGPALHLGFGHLRCGSSAVDGGI
ncbi:Uncharacterised protein [Mycobacteroides abscessus subsp. abscessus]|nr:Uncharacterised protein [Mycobacteroides abscessus subsp. abscessus]